MAILAGGRMQCAKSLDPSRTYTTQKISRGQTIGKRKLVATPKACVAWAGLPRRSGAKAGWTPERRARQAALIRQWAPWRQSTGPKTEAGKARCAKNALRHGGRSQAHILELRRITHVLRLVDQNIKALRLHIRLRDAGDRPQIQYKLRYRDLPKALVAPKPEGRRRILWRGLGVSCDAAAKQNSGGEPCVHWLL